MDTNDDDIITVSLDDTRIITGISNTQVTSTDLLPVAEEV